MDIAAGLNLAPGNLQELAQIIASDPVFCSKGAPILHQLTEEIGLATWHVMAGDVAFVESMRGTRLEDHGLTCFSIRSDVPPTGCQIPTLPWDYGRAPVPALQWHQAATHLKVREITFADDLSVCACSGRADIISEAVTHAVGSVLEGTD